MKILDPLHYGFGGLALLALGTTLYFATRLNIELRRVDALNTKLEAAGMHEAATARGWELNSLELQGELAQCQRQWLAVQDDAAAAVAQAVDGRSQAEQRLASFMARYRQRPQTCEAALQQLDVLCVGLEGY